jgi:hypothetical protein
MLGLSLSMSFSRLVIKTDLALVVTDQEGRNHDQADDDETTDGYSYVTLHRGSP